MQRAAPVAQWIEQPPPKGQVGRSIRLRGASKIRVLAQCSVGLEPCVGSLSAHLEVATARPLDSGRWQAVVRRGTRDLYRTFAAKSDASRWARMAEADIERAVFIDRTEAERTTLAAVIDRSLVEGTPQ